jgi:hypothetical protein
MLLIALFAAGLPYVGLRAIANEWRPAADGAAAERAVFGSLPTLWLQDHFFSGHYGILEKATVYFHMSWFFVPPLVTLIVLTRYRDEFFSYATWHTLALYMALIGFFLMPVQPPWLADHGVARILAMHWGGEVRLDSNPVAALPSLHVGLPLVLALWAATHKHRLIAASMATFATATAVSVVFLGEHYVIDVAGAVALALTVGVAGALSERSLAGIRSARPWRAKLAGARRLVGAEQGQNLLEFSMLMPVIVVIIGLMVILGLALNTRSSVQQAVREAARQVSVGVPVPTAQALAAGNAPDVLSPGDVRFCYPMNGTSQGKVGDPVRAYLHTGGSEGYKYTIVKSGGILKALNLPNLTVTMSPRATARLEKSVSSPNNCPS